MWLYPGITVVGTSYSSSDEGKYIGAYSKQTIDLLHIMYTPSSGEQREVYVSSLSEGVEIDSCGWSDVPCLTIHDAFTHCSTPHSPSLTILLYSGTLTPESLPSFFTQGIINIKPEGGSDVTKPFSSSTSLSDSLFICAGSDLRVSSIAFTTSESSVVYSLFSISSGKLSLTSVTVTPSDVVSVSKPVILFDASSDVTITSCSFANLSLSASSVNGAVIYGSVGEGKTFSIAGTDESKTTFTSCTVSSGNGGGVYVSGSASSTISVTHSSFSSCSAQRGGGMYVDLSTLSARSTLSLSFSSLSFTNNTATDKRYGNTLFIGASYIQYLSLEQFSAFITFTQSIDSEAYASIGDETPEVLSRVLSSFPFYIQGGGVDAECIYEDTPCSTIHEAAVSASNRECSEYRIVFLHSTLHPSESLHTEWTSGVSVVVEPDSSEGMETKSVSNIENEYTSLFSISGGCVTFTRIAFSISIIALKCGLIYLSSGEMRMNNVKVSALTEGSVISLTHSLISAESGTSVSLTCVEVEGVVLSEGNGAVVSAVLDEGSKVVFGNGCSLMQCSAVNGMGGAVYIRGSEGCLTRNTLVVNKIEVSGCGDKEGLNHSITIAGCSLGEFIEDGTPLWSSLIPSFSADNDALYRGIFTSDSLPSSSFALQHLCFSPSDGDEERIIVSASGMDGVACGWSDVPCSTLEGGVKQLGRSGRRIVMEKGKYLSETEEIVFEEEGMSREIEGMEGGGVWKEVKKIGEKSEGMFMIKEGNITFRWIWFELNCTEGYIIECPLFICRENGMMKIECVNITSSEVIGVCRGIMKSEGSINGSLISCLFENVSYGGSGRRGERMNDGDICRWDGGIVWMSNVSDVSVSGCVFNRTMNGGVVVEGGNVSLIDCSFYETCEEKEGFESVKHNVICSNEGNITMNGYNGDTIKKNTSLWIVIGDCMFETSEEKPDSLLYVPILKGVRYDGSGHLTFYGEMMIGCNLSYQIFYSDGDNYTLAPISLSRGESGSESEITHTLQNALFGGTSYTSHLIYGMNCTTEEKRILWPGEEYEEAVSEGSEGEGEGEGDGEGGGGAGGGGTKSEGGRGGGGRVSGVIVGVIGGVVIGGVVVGVMVTCICVWKRKGGEKEKRGKEEVIESEMIDSLLSYVEGEEGEKKEERFDSSASTDSSHSSSSSLWSESSSESSTEGRREEEEEEGRSEEGSEEKLRESERWSGGVLTTTSDGKTMNVSSDVQWPLSEGVYGQSGRRNKNRWR